MTSNRKVEFDAGRLIYDPATKKVTADKRKGRVTVQLNSAGEKKIEWTDIAANKKEVELYVFEGDAKFAKVVKSSGRVYLLDFESYDEKYFFWLQEKEDTNDEALCKKVNDIINMDPSEADKMEPEPPKAPQQAARSTASGVNPILSNMPNMSNLGALGQRGGPGGNNQQDLARMLQAALAQQQQVTRRQTPPLNDIFTPQVLDQFINDNDYQKALFPHLPTEQQNVQGLRETLKSAQLQQAIDSLDEALNSEEMSTVIMSLELDSSVLKDASDGTDALIKALEKWAKDHPN
jgi:hypothetical protein